jgi:prefoldin subunit 5
MYGEELEKLSAELREWDGRIEVLLRQIETLGEKMMAVKASPEDETLVRKLIEEYVSMEYGKFSV